MKKNNSFLVCFFLLICNIAIAQAPRFLFELPTPNTTDSSNAWVVLTDRIMDGSSRAESKSTDSSLIFEGNVINKNKAGLAQLISPRFNDSLHIYKGIVLRVRGDSSNYTLALQPDLFSTAARHLECTFVLTPDWQTLRIPFEAFECAYFEVPLTEKPPALHTIHHLSIINAYQEGRFFIEIGGVSLY
jgi:hypothetical protein